MMRPLFFPRPPGHALAAWCLAGLLLLAVVGSHASAGPDTAETPRAGLLLVASERMGDPRFARTVLLLLEADGGGAMGVILNRPLAGTLDEVMPDFPADAQLSLRLHRGGPVQIGRVTILARTGEDAPGLLPVMPGVRATMATDALQGLLQGRPAVSEARAYLGYAGWAPGQLEDEIARGDWSLHATTAAEVFETSAGSFWPHMRRRATGLWAGTPLRGGRTALQSPSRSTSTPSRLPSLSTVTSTRMGWQHTEQSST